MKKFSLVIVALMLSLGFASMVKADPIDISDQVEKLPGLKQGVGYSIEDSKVSYISTVDVLNFKGVDFEVGYATDDALIGVASYEVAKLKDFGVTVPILDAIEFNVGFYVGYKNIGGDNEFDYGPSLTLIDLKF